MRYLALVAGGGAGALARTSVEQRFLQVNPVLEALGNAQTNMNNNSSRCVAMARAGGGTHASARAQVWQVHQSAV